MYYQIIIQVILCLFLGFCAITDVLFQKIWLPGILFMMPLVLICLVCTGEGVGSNIICGCTFGTVLVGMSLATGGQVGKGDGLLLGVMGLALGWWEGMAFLFLSLIYAFLAALFLVTVRKKKRSYKMPFVPFALAGYATLLLLEGF